MSRHPRCTCSSTPALTSPFQSSTPSTTRSTSPLHQSWPSSSARLQAVVLSDPFHPPRRRPTHSPTCQDPPGRNPTAAFGNVDTAPHHRLHPRPPRPPWRQSSGPPSSPSSPRRRSTARRAGREVPRSRCLGRSLPAASRLRTGCRTRRRAGRGQPEEQTAVGPTGHGPWQARRSRPCCECCPSASTSRKPEAGGRGMAAEAGPGERSQRAEVRIPRPEGEVICSRAGLAGGIHIRILQGKLCTAPAEGEEDGRSLGLEEETGSAEEAGRTAVGHIGCRSAAEGVLRSRRHIHAAGFL
ncbi:hypothetical protein IWX90DRAFT_238463 [Phyllosticta citrichinensis]|uniref:Uncharacterized protein n=1 Tax=Phyllosticta citrichinensis TaxID=1130410 RepID=A0ABR1XQ20_9PEZI